MLIPIGRLMYHTFHDPDAHMFAMLHAIATLGHNSTENQNTFRHIYTGLIIQNSTLMSRLVTKCICTVSQRRIK